MKPRRTYLPSINVLARPRYYGGPLVSFCVNGNTGKKVENDTNGPP